MVLRSPFTGIETDSRSSNRHTDPDSDRSGTGPAQHLLEPLEPRLLLSGSISAQFVPVDNSAALPGYNTYDLQVTTDADWESAALLIELTGGSIYQNPAGGNRAPNPQLINAYPALEFDSYLAANGNMLSIVDRASEIGGDTLRFDSSGIDISWFDLATNDTGTIVIGRVTLSDDAAGSVGVMALGNTVDSFISSNTFTSGDLVNLTPAPIRPPSPPVIPPPPTTPLDFDVRFVEVDNSAALTGFKTFDLQVTTDTDWTISAMLIKLTRGSIYQDPAGLDRAPYPWELGDSPTLEFDSYVAANGNPVAIAGHAGDLGGNTLRFNTNKIDIAWFDSARNDIGVIVIGRVTVSDDAAGIVRVAVSTAGNLDSYISSEQFTAGNLSTGELTDPPPPPMTTRFVEVDGLETLAGYRTYDLRVNTATDWSNASLLIDLDQGSIYQDPAGTDLEPNPVTFSSFASLEYDTYITGNGRFTSVTGDADEVGSDTRRFDRTGIDVSWSGPAADDTGTIVIGRVTLSDDAVGRLKLKVLADNNVSEDSGYFWFGNLEAVKPTATPPSTSAADFTEDGKADIFWFNTQNGLASIWEMNQTTLVTTINLPAMANHSDWQAVGTADLTGDGKTDILWRNTRNGQNMVTEMDGTDVKENTYIKRLRNKAWTVGGVGDFTGDGKADILWRNTRNGRNSIWEMDGTTFREGRALKTVKSAHWNIAGVSDLTGDGKADILWRNTRNGRNTAWEMNDTSFQSRITIKQLRDQKWRVAGVGDYTGDGLADILWRNNTTGQNLVWQMNGTDYMSQISIHDQSDKRWQPAGTLLGLWE